MKGQHFNESKRLEDWKHSYNIPYRSYLLLRNRGEKARKNGIYERDAQVWIKIA
jgi:hypothetical protein